MPHLLPRPRSNSMIINNPETIKEKIHELKRGLASRRRYSDASEKAPVFFPPWDLRQGAILANANLEYQEERPRPEYLDEIFHKVRRVEVELIAKKIDIRGAIKAFIAIIGNDEYRTSEQYAALRHVKSRTTFNRMLPQTKTKDGLGTPCIEALMKVLETKKPSPVADFACYVFADTLPNTNVWFASENSGKRMQTMRKIRKLWKAALKETRGIPQINMLFKKAVGGYAKQCNKRDAREPVGEKSKSNLGDHKANIVIRPLEAINYIEKHKKQLFHLLCHIGCQDVIPDVAEHDVLDSGTGELIAAAGQDILVVLGIYGLNSKVHQGLMEVAEVSGFPVNFMTPWSYGWEGENVSRPKPGQTIQVLHKQPTGETVEHKQTYKRRDKYDGCENGDRLSIDHRLSVGISTKSAELHGHGKVLEVGTKGRCLYNLQVSSVVETGEQLDLVTFGASSCSLRPKRRVEEDVWDAPKRPSAVQRSSSSTVGTTSSSSGLVSGMDSSPTTSGSSTAVGTPTGYPGSYNDLPAIAADFDDAHLNTLKLPGSPANIDLEAYVTWGGQAAPDVGKRATIPLTTVTHIRSVPQGQDRQPFRREGRLIVHHLRLNYGGGDGVLESNLLKPLKVRWGGVFSSQWDDVRGRFPTVKNRVRMRMAAPWQYDHELGRLPGFDKLFCPPVFREHRVLEPNQLLPQWAL